MQERACFCLEERRGPRQLLASISAASNEQPNGLRLPSLPNGLAASVKRLARGARKQVSIGSGGPGQHLRSHRLPPPPDLGQLQQLAVAAGGVLVAAVSQAAQRLASVRPGRKPQTLPFYQSFKLPWNVGARRGSRRCEPWRGAAVAALAAAGAPCHLFKWAGTQNPMQQPRMSTAGSRGSRAAQPLADCSVGRQCRACAAAALRGVASACTAEIASCPCLAATAAAAAAKHCFKALLLLAPATAGFLTLQGLTGGCRTGCRPGGSGPRV